MNNQQKGSETFEITLENPAYGGDTIGRLPDGRAVFVPYGIPGERVKIRIVSDKKKYARGELLEILDPSPFRIQPRCQHFGDCGGCHYQHISYEQQMIIKQKILRDQLERIGRLEEPVIEPVIPSPKIFNYRNHVQFKVGKNKKLGFYRSSKNGVLEIDECHLPDEMIDQIWPMLEIDPQTGIKSIGLRKGEGEDMLLILESPQLFDADFDVETLPVSVAHISPEGEQVLAGSPNNIIQVKERNFLVSAGSFFQINIPLVEQVIDLIETRIPDQVGLALELYSGVGLFSAFLAGKVERLIAIESSESAGEDFVTNLDQFENVELYQGNVEKILPFLDIEPEIVLVDPPRTGLKRVVLANLIEKNPDLIVYISCDPATLARDSRIMTEGGYIPEKFIPYDFFSQTFHIETVSFWRKK
jgi:23S rRNA (uracil1939-C5)-methyltransferase